MVEREPLICRVSAIEFAVGCGVLHSLLAGGGLALAVSSAEIFGQVVFFMFVSYFTAVSIWVVARGWALRQYLGSRPARSATSIWLHLAGGLFVLFVGGLAGDFLVLGFVLFGADCVVPAFATWWVIDTADWVPPQGTVTRSLLLAVVLGVLAVASCVLVLYVFWTLLPSDP